MKTLGYMLFQQRYANTTSTGQLYRTELLTRSMHRQVVGLLQQAKEERMLVFSLYTILSHPSTVLCVCVCVLCGVDACWFVVLVAFACKTTVVAVLKIPVSVFF